MNLDDFDIFQYERSSSGLYRVFGLIHVAK